MLDLKKKHFVTKSKKLLAELHELSTTSTNKYKAKTEKFEDIFAMSSENEKTYIDRRLGAPLAEINFLDSLVTALLTLSRRDGNKNVFEDLPDEFANIESLLNSLASNPVNLINIYLLILRKLTVITEEKLRLPEN